MATSIGATDATVLKDPKLRIRRFQGLKSSGSIRRVKISTSRSSASTVVSAVFTVGLKYNESMVIRVTGCPNGCARPYMAELGLAGDGPQIHQIWLGGTPNQTTLAKCFMNKVKVQDLEKVLEPLFYSWKNKRQKGESLDVFNNRMGFDNLQETVEKWEGLVERSSRSYLKLFVDKETYEAMDALAKLQNKDAHQLAMEVIRNFVTAQQNGKSE